MKKLILFLLLVLTINTTFAQEYVPKEFRRVYTQVAFIIKREVTRREAENVILFNYGNKSEIKIYMSDGSIRYYEQVSDRDEGSTEGGMQFDSAIYQEKGKTLRIYVQLFEDRQYGCRFIFANGDMVQFLE